MTKNSLYRSLLKTIELHIDYVIKNSSYGNCVYYLDMNLNTYIGVKIFEEDNRIRLFYKMDNDYERRLEDSTPLKYSTLIRSISLNIPKLEVVDLFDEDSYGN